MNTVLPQIPYDKLNSELTLKDIAAYIPNENVLKQCIDEAVKKGELTPVCGDVYFLGRSVNKGRGVSLTVAATLYDPASYVSGVSALRYYDWIPESFMSVWLATSSESKDVKADCAYFLYNHIAQLDYQRGVKTVDYFGEQLRQATPLKAIADYIASRENDSIFNETWKKYGAIDMLEEDLRIWDDDYGTLAAHDFDEVQGNYPDYPNVEAYLVQLRKEMRL